MLLLEKLLFFEHERTHCFRIALQSRLEEVSLLMFQNSKEKRSHHVGEGLLPALRYEAGRLLNYLAFSQEIKIDWPDEPVTSPVITIALLDGWAGKA